MNWKPSVLWLQTTIIGLVIILGVGASMAQGVQNRQETNISALKDLSTSFDARAEERRTSLYYELVSRSDGPQGALNDSPDIELMGVDIDGQPIFYSVWNLSAAQTISTDIVWPGGYFGWGLDLSGLNSPGQLAIWDGGGVLDTHQEFGGRVTIKDSPGGTHYHATHVAGTMIAGGIDPNAKGMSFGAFLDSYDWSDDESEMASAASAGLLVSNHSYGIATGWRFGGTDWYWYGNVNVDPNEDYRFGFYGSGARSWDEIANNAPYYLIVKSAGNDRNDAGPGLDMGHYYWDSDLSDWAWSTDQRDPDGGPLGYDTVSYAGNAKNILTVGAVDDVPPGYRTPEDIVMSSFSGWGPSDDGRIKPDLVANGISLWSCDNSGDAEYRTLSGTSMSSPNASGSINLLTQQFMENHSGSAPLASTVKALLIHTADEAGEATGPDYQNGWGLMNTSEAAELIDKEFRSPGRIFEATLSNGESHEYSITAVNRIPVVATLVWNDPAGPAQPAVVDPAGQMLVNDLDVRLEVDGETYYPFVLDPDDPELAATTGDNFRDNVEKIWINLEGTPPFPPIQTMDAVIRVSHKGTLSEPQAYSLVLSRTVGSAEDDLWCRDFYPNPNGNGISGSGYSVGVGAMAMYDGRLVAAGDFSQVGDLNVGNIASWNGLHWSSLGVGTDDEIRALVVYDGQLIAGGDFTNTSDGAANRVARWDGTSWSPLGVGIGDGSVTAMAVYEGDLIVGGDFSEAGGSPTAGLARWDGSNWEPLATELTSSFPGSSPGVHALTVYGGQLIVGGHFRVIDGQPFVNIAAWDGTQWHDVGGAQLFGAIVGAAYALMEHDGNLVVGGALREDASSAGNGIAQWDGTTWTPLGNGTNNSVVSLGEFNGQLVAGGAFSRPGMGVAQWDGSQWSTFGSGFQEGYPEAIQVCGDHLLMGGAFQSVGDFLTYNIAGWGGCGSGLSSVEGESGLPDAVVLHPCYPNPFNPATTISFDLPAASKVDLRIYDISGRLVKRLLNGEMTDPGRINAVWRGVDERGRQVAAGVYFYRLDAGGHIETRRMTLVK